jgi:hypothetical protein
LEDGGALGAASADNSSGAISGGCMKMEMTATRTIARS